MKKILVSIIVIIAAIVVISVIILDKSYIDIWKCPLGRADIDLYSKGTGDEKMIYLGYQPTHYFIYNNGEIYTSVNGSFKNEKTGKIDKPTVTHITTLSYEEIISIKSKLNEIIRERGVSNDAYDINASYWYIKKNGISNMVDANVYEQVLEEHF